jgi:ABC-type polysaccharide/polyol phosphate transport system ATPase subunit
MKYLPKEGLCLETINVSKIYHKSTARSSNQNSKIQKLFSVLWGSENVEKKDIETFHALKEVSLSLKSGESLGIIGLNGSGKSTLMQIIAGTLSPSSGKVCVQGKVAALLELGSGFNPDFTGKENVIINGKILGLTESEIKLKLQSIQNFAEIGDFFHQAVSTYSSGMILRLAFAVLAHINPDILIIDEALAVGDAKFQLKCFTFLEEFKNKGGTLILVSHDLNSIARLCSHSILLHEGSLLASGKPFDVINEYSKILSLDECANETAYENKSSLNRTQILETETSTEFSYGGKKAIINDVKLFNNQNEEINVLKSGEEFSVSYTVEAKENVNAPIYAMTIKDAKGQQVYGQNTRFAKVQVDNLDKGARIQVKFQQRSNLGSGDYFISVGVTCFRGENLQVIHRRYDALEIKVINTDGSFGIANCYSKVEMKDVSVAS